MHITWFEPTCDVEGAMDKPRCASVLGALARPCLHPSKHVDMLTCSFAHRRWQSLQGFGKRALVSDGERSGGIGGNR